MAEENVTTIDTAETNTELAAPPDANAEPGTTAEGTGGFTSTEGAGGDAGADDADKEAKAEERKRNAENARRRREAEAAERIKKAEINAIKRVLPENPYTHQPIETDADVEDYLIMRGIAESGGDPVNDYFSKVREKRAGEQRATDDAARLQGEIRDFIAKNPDVNVAEVLEDPDFNEYAEGKLGKKALAKVYEDYKGFKAKFTAQAVNDAAKRAAQEMANAQAAVGSLNNSKPNANDGFFTKEQVKAMSREEIKKNYEKIRESQAKW